MLAAMLLMSKIFVGILDRNLSSAFSSNTDDKFKICLFVMMYNRKQTWRLYVQQCVCTCTQYNN